MSLIAGGEPQLAAQSTLDFGLVVRTPMIEITTIGAGGGSIARVDAAGLLQVGPQSAGSTPGPACFGVGDRPTLTDANVVLGRINAERPIGGSLKRLDIDAAARAIERDVGRPLGFDITAAAAAILRVANARMASALRLVSVERGHDPQKFSFMPFGGGGALHAGALIREVGLARALVPRFPGVTSALGCVIADMRHDRVQTLNRLLADLDPLQLHREMDGAMAELSVLLDRATVAFTGRQTVHELDMSYLGQTHTVAVRVRPGSSRQELAAAFEATYGGAFGRIMPGVAIRVLNLRTAVVGLRPKLDLMAMAPAADATVEAAQRGVRRIWFADWSDVPVLDRLALPAHCIVAGPAVLEQPDTTILIEPRQQGRVDRFGNLILEAA